jgi:hypothetical protein
MFAAWFFDEIELLFLRSMTTSLGYADFFAGIIQGSLLLACF